jgi:2-oxoglutarate ferredoxin oxidoreductase subunit delta
MKKIIVDSTFCKGCNICTTICAKQALKPGTSRSKKGYLMPETIPDNCVGCGSCEIVCPDFAISVCEEG